MSEWPFPGLEPGKYGAILADPPWAFDAWGTQKNAAVNVTSYYDTMSIAHISALPVKALAARNSILFMWICWPTMKHALDVIDAWGFTYKTCGFCWIKVSANGEPRIGTGYWTRANSEVCLIATRGKPKRTAMDVHQAILEPRREHSRKPDCVYERIERLVAGPYCELFARTRRPGWDSWGNQVGMFG